MAFELPLERSVERQARPKAVFGRLNPGRGLGDASKLSGGMPLPKLGGLKKLSEGGIVGYADGGDYEYQIPYLNSPGAETLPNSPMYFSGSSNDNPQVSAPSTDMLPAKGLMALPSYATVDQDEPLPDPAMTNTSFNRGSEGLGARLATQGIAYRQAKNGYSYDQTGKAVDPDTGEQLSGFRGWMANKHALGITGSDWLKAALTAATGILGQAVAKRNQTLNNRTTAAPSGHNMIAPAIGVNPQGYGITGGYAAGGPAMAGPMPPQQPPAAPQGPGGQQMGQSDPQSQTIVINAAKALMGQMDPQSAQAALQAFVQAFGQEALQQLAQQIKQSQGGQQQGGIAAAAPQQGMAMGGALMSDGGGMDDTIPANNGQVALSGGEFIVPADAVAALGDGNNAAGVKKLQQGIAQLRTMKYGRAKQPPKLPHGSNPVMGR